MAWTGGEILNGNDMKMALHRELVGGYSGDQLVVRLLLFYCLFSGELAVV